MAPRGRFQRYPSSTTTPYHSNGTQTAVFAAYFTDGSYWRVLTVHIASLEVRKGSIAPFGTPSSNDAICAFETFERRLERRERTLRIATVDVAFGRIARL